MKWVELILTIVKFALEVWRNRTDPIQAKIKAAAAATKDLNKDIKKFDKALSNNDAHAISEHFEQLRLRILKATGAVNDRKSKRT